MTKAKIKSPEQWWLWMPNIAQSDSMALPKNAFWYEHKDTFDINADYRVSAFYAAKEDRGPLLSEANPQMMSVTIALGSMYAARRLDIIKVGAMTTFRFNNSFAHGWLKAIVTPPLVHIANIKMKDHWEAVLLQPWLHQSAPCGLFTISDIERAAVQMHNKAHMMSLLDARKSAWWKSEAHDEVNVATDAFLQTGRADPRFMLW